MFKIVKLLVKLEKWLAERCYKDTVEYEDWLQTIKRHETEIERIDRERKL